MDESWSEPAERASLCRRAAVSVSSIACDGNVLVMISGELDMKAALLVRETLEAIIGDPSTTAVEVDVAGVTFIDVLGVRSLILARRAAIAGAQPFRLLMGKSGAVRYLLNLTQLSSIFD